MVGNFKYFVFILFYITLFSCQNKQEKSQLGKELITENLPILLDNLDYFDVSESPLSVGIYQYVGEIKSDQNIVIEKFQNKFNLNDEEISEYEIKLEKIPKKIGNHFVFLNTDNAFHKKSSMINISFVNLIISKNNKYASIEVVKSLGSGAKFEIYHFKQDNGKWIFAGKEIIGLG
ncbi:hypothetical protein [Chryseobacterium arthrosphaerae]|nr:hypothetical protein [Chryseobacterium arthrosphaerae]